MSATARALRAVTPDRDPARPWHLLIVDDDDGVLAVTRLTLRDLTYEGRRIVLHEARSAAEARLAVAETPMDVILLDIVMESERAGLEFVNHVRQELHDRIVRIIIRTGQPGSSSPLELIKQYEIDGYCVKTELTALILKIEVITALRNVRLLRQLQASSGPAPGDR